jgi:DoxX-like family
MEKEKTNSKAMIWTGRIISTLCVLFLIVDGGMKAIKAMPSMEGSVQLGWPENLVQSAGLILLVCTALYLIPRTAILGAILLTGYLGGATAIMVRTDTPYLFPVIFGIFVWAGIFLRNEKLRKLIPLNKAE